MNTYVVVDIETTGTKPLESDIIEIGAVYIEDGKVKDTFNTLVRPTQMITSYITSITGITNEMVQKADPIEVVMPKFITFCKSAVLIGHNVIVFDYRMLKVKATRLGLPFEKKAIDTLTIARKVLGHLPSRKLGDLCAYYDIPLMNAHRAYDDAYATYLLFTCLQKDFYENNKILFEPEKMTWELPKFVPITKKQEGYLLKLMEMHKIKYAQDIRLLSKSEASRKIDQLIQEYGKSR
jgi:DNA polymerase-3 subunit alpha (Gram-positive type)